MSYKIEIKKDIPMKTRDGTTLYSDIFFPIPKIKNETFPVLLIRTPYNKSFCYNLLYKKFTITTEQDFFPQHGYILVIQDVRGRFKSEGEFYPFKYEAQDGYDAVEWCAGLEKSNGKVGTVGQSYMGFTQLALATTAPPSLKAQSVVSGFLWLFENCIYRNGIFESSFIFKYCNMLMHNCLRKKGISVAPLDNCYNPQGFLQNFLLGFFDLMGFYDLNDFFRMAMISLEKTLENSMPLSSSGEVFEKLGFEFFNDFLKNNQPGPFWEDLSNSKDFDKINVPILHIGSWYDYFQNTTLELFQRLKKSSSAPQKILMGPWGHLIPFSKPNSYGAGDLNFGEKAKIFIHEYQLRWFDYHLKGIDNGVLNEDPNDWINQIDWPVPNTSVRSFFIGSKGHANSIKGNGVLCEEIDPSWNESNEFDYDPSNPVPTLGGTIIASESEMGGHDQSILEQRNDILIFTSKPFSEDLTLCGKVSVTLFVKSSCCDTDFVAKLCDVHPSGYSLNICDGIIRMSFRNPSKPKKIKPNKIYKITIDCWSTARTIFKNHSLRLHITSSNHPRYDRNLNSENPNNAFQKDFFIAHQTIFHSSSFPSILNLVIL